MQLLPCPRPIGPLESAPRTSLRADSERERWDGFWSEDERYYARCTRWDGSEQWYRIEDTRGVIQFRRRGLQPRVSAGVPRGSAMIVSTRAGGGSMLVGTWRRRGARPEGVR